MHTLTVIGGGLLLLAALVGLGHLAGRRVLATRVFIPVWLICTLANLYVGVTQAGYTIWQELPVQLLVFGVPAITAVIAGRNAGAS